MHVAHLHSNVMLCYIVQALHAQDPPLCSGILQSLQLYAGILFSLSFSFISWKRKRAPLHRIRRTGGQAKEYEKLQKTRFSVVSADCSVKFIITKIRDWTITSPHFIVFPRSLYPVFRRMLWIELGTVAKL
jgi:hypothetical protein